VGNQLIEWVRSARSRQVVAAVLVTATTAALIGIVLVAATPLGCGPANALGLKSISTRCGPRTAAASPGTPSPSPLATFSTSASPSPSPTAVFSPSPLPSNLPPDTGPASGAYPPFYPASTDSGGHTIAALSLNCRLPVFAGPPGSGGFVVFPGGAFVADPASAVGLPSPPPGGSPVASPTPGYSQQNTGLSYDAAYKKWVPVSITQVSPDGSRYAFASSSSIYVEDVASGTLSEIGRGQAWNIIGVQAAGVYAMQQNKAGLWLVPYSGDPTQITSAGFWQAASSVAAYGTPTSAVPSGATNDIIRVDLKTGALATWFSRKDTQTSVMGIGAGGAPIIFVNYQAPYYVTEVWIVPSAGRGIPLGGGNSGYGSINLNGPPVTDSYGTWFLGGVPYGGSGMVLYVLGKGLYWMSNLYANLAGGCVQP